MQVLIIFLLLSCPSLILYHVSHHGHEHSSYHYNTNYCHEYHLVNFCEVNHINPKDPAVIPTVTKNPNSRRSLEPGGIDVNNSASGIIEGQKINRLCMQLLPLLLRKLVDTCF